MTTKEQQSEKKEQPKNNKFIDKVASDFTCKYCDQPFKFKQSMYRHIKYTCPKRRIFLSSERDEDLKELVRQLNIKIEIQSQELIKRTEYQDKKIEYQEKQIEKLMGNL